MDIPKLVDCTCARLAVILKLEAEKMIQEEMGGKFHITEEEERQLEEEFPFIKDMDPNRYKNEREFEEQKVQQEEEKQAEQIMT